jgi:hypothetical protein
MHLTNASMVFPLKMLRQSSLIKTRLNLTIQTILFKRKDLSF